jgi:hypothetical protein
VLLCIEKYDCKPILLYRQLLSQSFADIVFGCGVEMLLEYPDPPIGATLYTVHSGDLFLMCIVKSDSVHCLSQRFSISGATFKSCPSGREASDGRRQIFSIRPVKLQGHLPRLNCIGCLRRQDQ